MSDVLRVALFTESYLPYLSGVTIATETLARGLGARGHHVLLLAPEPGDGVLPPEAGAPGPDPEYAWLPSYQGLPPAPPGYRMPLPVPSSALRRARDFAPDIVHAQSPFVSGLMARRLAQRLRAPLVFTHHTRFADYRHYLGPLAGPGAAAMRAHLRDFWAGCAAVVAPGSQLAAEIRAELGGRARPVVRVLPTGVDVDAIRVLPAVDVRAEHGWPADAVVAVSVGRLAIEKSVELLLEAFALAAARSPLLRLLLVGGGPAEPALRERARAVDLSGLVAFSGALSRTEALSRAKGADLFVFASRTETQGLVVVEALAAGLPVVARDGPGVADALRSGTDGLVVEAAPGGDDPWPLAGAIVELAGDARRRASFAAAAREGAPRFDVRQRIGEMEALYREMLTGRTTSR